MNNRIKKILVGVTGLILLIALVACGNNQAESDTTIRVGTKDFTENLIVGELYALALEDAGYDVERMPNITGSVIHTSILNDEIDIYPEYTGTGLLTILNMDLITDPEEVYQTVKQEYDEQFDLTWLDYSEANDGAGLVIRTEVSEELGITTISDLQEHASEIRFASQGEVDQREDGIPLLEKVYGEFNWKSSKVYDNGIKYEVLKNDEADVAPAYTTEGQLTNTEEFTLLEDDKQVWPPYNLAPVIRNEVLDNNPEIEEVINKVSATLDTKTVTELNAKVDLDKEEYTTVAKEYYESIK
ncbi:osmoprotectant transport system substrate-binding protein [Gracilibacillus ureilyticus]|uniref:Osmoprotectant transport system substrate-binding protein n=1 Tax=Gracilibacillus ureilyticus TaxID=531814 RepID=A0A1H9T949_9BACI|nr:glycine betaine ABC transporter substrate-binding protein [Gracilibacillus ureilyticus]SER93648.1 osmoprotectant transport system substrate-binding protein [Gracilibacillus ureilyticus]